MPITTIDLNFSGQTSAIATYLIPHAEGAALIDCGPSTTLPTVLDALAVQSLQPANVTDVFLTHIHFDHGGAAGWWARQNARIHVHPIGAPHLINPTKLLASATRIYGEQMGWLWGDFLPVPEDKLVQHKDGDRVELGGLAIDVLETPGHASHHLVYLCEQTAFLGDVGGVRLPAIPTHIRLPTPPPEFHLETWRTSLKRLQRLQSAGKFNTVAPTHFGQFDDAAWHLNTVNRKLDALEAWMATTLPKVRDADEIRHQFRRWEETQAAADGLTADQVESSMTAGPSDMSADGVARYWKKYRAVTE